MNYMGAEFVVVKAKKTKERKPETEMDYIKRVVSKLDIPIYVIAGIWVIWLYVH